MFPLSFSVIGDAGVAAVTHRRAQQVKIWGGLLFPGEIWSSRRFIPVGAVGCWSGGVGGSTSMQSAAASLPTTGCCGPLGRTRFFRLLLFFCGALSCWCAASPAVSPAPWCRSGSEWSCAKAARTAPSAALRHLAASVRPADQASPDAACTASRAAWPAARAEATPVCAIM